MLRGESVVWFGTGTPPPGTWRKAHTAEWRGGVQCVAHSCFSCFRSGCRCGGTSGRTENVSFSVGQAPGADPRVRLQGRPRDRSRGGSRDRSRGGSRDRSRGGSRDGSRGGPRDRSQGQAPGADPGSGSRGRTQGQAPVADPGPGDGNHPQGYGLPANQDPPLGSALPLSFILFTL